jgi:preprotein translocase subunit SecB
MEQSKFSFRNPWLTKLEYIVNESFLPQNDGTSDIPCSIRHQLDIVDDESIANIEITLEVGDNSDKYPFYVLISFESDFKWDTDSFSEDTLKELLNKNAPALLLSYARPIVAMITNSSKYPVFNLPFVDFNNYTWEQSEDSEK